MGRLRNRKKKNRGTNLYNIPFVVSGDTGVHVFIDDSGNVTQIKKKQKERLKYYIDPELQIDFASDCVIGVNGGGLRNLYTFSSGTTESDPSSGYLKFNSTYNITEIYISEFVSGETLSSKSWFDRYVVADGSIFLKIFNEHNVNHLATFEILSITYNTNWYKIEVTPIINFYNFDNNELVYFTYEQTNCISFVRSIGLGLGDNDYGYA
jgi:hypothetical protein